MTEQATEAATAEPTAEAQDQPTPPSWDELFKGQDPAKVHEALEQSRKWETRAKENHAKAKQYDALEQASKTELERAVDQARAEGRTAAASEYGARLARERFDALAGRRNPDFDTKAALEYVDLTKFVNEDGEPDEKAITAAIARLVPEPANGVPSFDGGARTTAPKAPNMNDFIRKAAGRA